MLEKLKEAASAARKNAYCPYSHYPVGAALLDERDKIHAGCNVENAAYPVGMCAERGALAQLVATGSREVRAVLVLTRDGAPPCGACLQALGEFVAEPGEVRVWLCSERGECVERTFRELFPVRFGTRKE
jgi:cytidine deaminase